MCEDTNFDQTDLVPLVANVSVSFKKPLYNFPFVCFFFWVPGHDFWTATGPFRPPGQGGGVLFGMGLYYIYVSILGR